MRSWLNCISCFGGLWLIGGIALAGIALTGHISNDPNSYTTGAAIGGVAALFGLILVLTQVRSAGTYSRIVGVARSQKSITIKELSMKSGVAESKVGPLLYDAISAGDLSGTIEGVTFTLGTSSPTPSYGGAKVLVICPYCGAKTEQGLSTCQKCGASL